MAKYLKTPYPQFTQSKPTIPTKQQRSPYIERFGWKREIRPVQKLKGKIEEMHDLNKPSAASCHHIDIAD